MGFFIQEYRLPKIVTAILSGMALSAAGLQMQTMFRNPLADPFILGINSGASLGVALAIMGAGLAGGLFIPALSAAGSLGLVASASLGAAFVMGLILLVGGGSTIRTHFDPGSDVRACHQCPGKPVGLFQRA